jgi:predicted RNA methylase
VSSDVVHGDLRSEIREPQLNISQKALETLPEDDNVVPKHVRVAIHN